MPDHIRALRFALTNAKGKCPSCEAVLLDGPVEHSCVPSAAEPTSRDSYERETVRDAPDTGDLVPPDNAQ